MMFFIEEVIVEFAVTLTLGAVFGFMSGLVTTTLQQADRRDRLQACRCGSVATIEVRPDQDRASKGYRR